MGLFWCRSDVLDSLDLTMDENKENQTPEGPQQLGELDWVQQYNLDQEREEQELQQALAQSLQEHVRPEPPPDCSWTQQHQTLVVEHKAKLFLCAAVNK